MIVNLPVASRQPHPWYWTRLAMVFCWASTSGLLALADPPATRPSPQDLATPRDALLAYDRWCVDLQDFDDAAAFYTATTDQEKACVQQSLKFDRVSAAIERLARQAFGPASCTAILHEYGEVDVPDLQSAVVTVNGNTATVRIPALQFELQMVKVGDAWLIDTAALIKSYGGLNNAVQTINNQTITLRPIVDGLQSGKFKTAQDVIHAIDQVTGGPQN